MKGSFSSELAVFKIRLKRVAPLIFSLLQTLNQWRNYFWTSPLLYVWRNSHLGHALGVSLFRLTQGRLTSASASYRIFDSSLRLHNYQQAFWIADMARCRYPDAIDIVAMQCTLALSSGAMPDALALLERCLLAKRQRSSKAKASGIAPELSAKVHCIATISIASGYRHRAMSAIQKAC